MAQSPRLKVIKFRGYWKLFVLFGGRSCAGNWILFSTFEEQI